YLDKLHVTSGFHDFAGDFVPQDQSLRSGGTPTNHVLVAATNIGGDNLKDDAVLAFAVAERKLGEIYILNFDDAGAHVSYATIACHAFVSLIKGEFTSGTSMPRVSGIRD